MKHFILAEFDADNDGANNAFDLLSDFLVGLTGTTTIMMSDEGKTRAQAFEKFDGHIKRLDATAKAIADSIAGDHPNE